MQLFREEEGRYVYGGRRSALLKLVAVAPVVGMVLLFFFVGFVAKREGGEELERMGPVLVPSLVISTAVMAIVIILIFKRFLPSGRIVIDLPASRLEFGDPVSLQIRKRTELELTEVREIVLAYRPSGVFGRAQGPVWVVRALTAASEEYDLLVSADRSKAAQFATELSSLSSLILRDMTGSGS
jgi:hypothetical protein